MASDTPNTGSESPLSVTFKTPGATLITVRGGNRDELSFALADLSLPVMIEGDESPTSVAEMVSAIEKSFRPSGGAAQLASQAQQQQAAQSSGHPCSKCGQPANFKEGTNRSGKPYKGWFCTSGSDGHVDWVK